MAVVGIISEYNPFHLGHAWQIAELRRRLGADTAVVCAMSGNFVQRGECAIMEKHARAEAALHGGADLVLELPLPWAISSAESFAAGGVGVLAAAGVVDTLAFGSECGNGERLMRLAERLLSEEFSAALKARLGAGTSYASVRAAAMRDLVGDEAALLERPNDILGVEYCKAIRAGKVPMSVLALERRGVDHDGGAKDGFASASFIREKLRAGEDASDYLTSQSAAAYYREANGGCAPAGLNYAERAILSKLRSMTEEDLAAYDGGGEGLYHRFYAAVQSARSMEEILELAKTKRYAHARLRRMLLAAFLGVPSAAELEIPYLHVLGCNGRGRELLAAMKKSASVPVITKSAEARRLPSPAKELFALEARSTDQYVLMYPQLSASAAGSEWTRGPVIL
ncbi:MAG: nucleotidyltransferase family protein [Oscillospiraceae bacterium]|nr:nucleotidyltransferase family protein [Oscillospiraceae bacterium]